MRSQKNSPDKGKNPRAPPADAIKKSLIAEVKLY